MQYACILALATMGIVLIFKTSFTTNFAQGSLAVFGCYVTADYVARLSGNFIFGILIGLAAAFAFGIVIDVFIIRKGRRVTAVGKQMITMGIVLFLTGTIPLIFGNVPIPVQRFLSGNTLFSLFGANLVITNQALASLGLTAIILTSVFLALKYTKWGLGVRATASNEAVASMMGINTHFITAFSWAIAGALGAMAAIMYASSTSLSVGLMTSVQVNGFLASILGGFSTFFGPIVGAFLIPIIGNIIGFSASLWKDVIVYVLILIVILIKPLGLFGKKTIKKV